MTTTYPFTLHLNQLRLKARLGVFEWERAQEREFPLDVTAGILAADSVREDDLTATVDYAALESLLLEKAAAQEWQLIERLLHALAHEALQNFPQIQSLTLTLAKPQALAHCESAAVSYTAHRH